MLPEKAVQAVEQQAWLDSVSDGIQPAVHKVFEAGGPTGQQVKNFLHGTWLGHQLHPVLTDVPLGAWTVAITLDAMEAMGDRRDLAPGADAAVAIGLAGAVGAAVTGVTDWSATDGEARRLGMAHGLMNVGVAALYGASLLCRQRGDRSTGRQLAALGYAVGMVSAYLGGHLVFAKRIGVDHADVEGAPDQFTRVLRADELAENQPRRVEVDGVPVLLVRQGERIFALAETCSHLGGPLSEGEIEGCSVRCPWHGSRFALDDGRVLDGPATNPQPRFDARVRDGHIEIRLAGADTTDAAPTDGATEHLAQPTAAQPTPTTVNGETQGSTAAQDASI